MAGVPAWLLRHTVVVEPYAGSGAYGDVYGPPAQVRCLVDEGRRLVRADTGDEVVSEATVRAPVDTDAPAGSRVTLPDGRVATVITARRREAPGLPTPDHLELALT